MANRATYAGHARALLTLGLPLVGSHLASLFLHMTDTVMLGWFGIEELAAVVLGGTFWFVLFVVGSGFGTALAAPIASAMAQGDETQVRRLTRMGIWLTLGYGMLVSPIYLFAEPILLAMGQKPRVAELCGQYLALVGYTVFATLLTNLLRSYLSAMGKTMAIMVVTLSALVLHAWLNWVLIFGHMGMPALGIRGAAISSLLTDGAVTLVLLAYALRKFPQHRLLRNFWRVDREALSRIFQLGWPVSMQMLAEVGMFAGAAIMMGWAGAEMLAAHGIATQITAVTFLVHLGLSNAATIRAGQAHGRGDAQDLRDGALTGVVLSVLFAAATIAVFLAIPEFLVRLFLNPADPATPNVVAAGITLMTMAAIFQLADGGQAMVLGLLRGVQDVQVPMVIALVSYWLIGMPAAYVLGFTLDLGGIGVWSGLVLGLATVWIALSVRFWLGPARQGALA